VVGPKDAKMTLVFIGDIFSNNSSRIKENADFLADRGFHVVVPDFHKGDSCEYDFGPQFMQNFRHWLDRHPIDEVVRMVEQCIKQVHGEGKKVATVGYCWGAWV